MRSDFPSNQELFVFEPLDFTPPDLFEVTTIILKNPTTGASEELPAGAALHKQRTHGWQIVSTNAHHAARAATLWTLEEMLGDGYDEKLCTIRLEIGDCPKSNFVVDFQMKTVNEADLIFLQNDLWQVRLVSNSRLGNIKIFKNLLVAQKFFRQMFVGCTGAAIAVDGADGVKEIRIFSPELREKFIVNIDPFWQHMIIESLI